VRDVRDEWNERARTALTLLFWLMAGVFLCYLILTVPLPALG
jgi:hypothetical protein